MILKLLSRAPDSPWAKIVSSIMKHENSGLNVYLNFQLTFERQRVVKELRKLWKAKKIFNYSVDCNGNIGFRFCEGDDKIKVSPPNLNTLLEIFSENEFDINSFLD